MTELQGFHHVAVTVSDLDRSVDWYGAVLGFAELFREENDDRRACIMQAASGSPTIGLVGHRGNDGTAFDPTRLGLDHLAFTVATQADLEQWAHRLTTAGVTHSGVIEIPPGAILNCKDPDGIALALFWDR